MSKAWGKSCARSIAFNGRLARESGRRPKVSWMQRENRAFPPAKRKIIFANSEYYLTLAKYYDIIEAWYQKRSSFFRGSVVLN